MQQKIPELALEIRKGAGAHVFYLTEQTGLYIENVLVFILDGIKNKDYVLIVESKRLTPIIKERLQNILTAEELAKVYFFDNFNLYWQKGNFMPSSIIEYFRETFETSLLEEGNFRTWGHIEWSTQDSLEEELLTYEMEVGRLISEHNLIAVCAYDAMRVNEDLREQLGTYHNYLMKDDQITAL